MLIDPRSRRDAWSRSSTEAFAKRYFEGQNPVGREIRLMRLATLPPTPAPGSHVRGDRCGFGCEEPEHPGTVGSAGLHPLHAAAVLQRQHLRADRRPTRARVLNVLRHEIQAVESAGGADRAGHRWKPSWAASFSRVRVSACSCSGSSRAPASCWWRSASMACSSTPSRNRPAKLRSVWRSVATAATSSPWSSALGLRLIAARPGLRDCREPGHEPAARQPAVGHVTPRSVDVPGRPAP